MLDASQKPEVGKAQPLQISADEKGINQAIASVKAIERSVSSGISSSSFKLPRMSRELLRSNPMLADKAKQLQEKMSRFRNCSYFV